MRWGNSLPSGSDLGDVLVDGDRAAEVAATLAARLVLVLAGVATREQTAGARREHRLCWECRSEHRFE